MTMTDITVEPEETIITHGEEGSTPTEPTSIQAKPKPKKAVGGDDNLKCLKSAPFIKKALSEMDDELAIEKLKVKIVGLFDARIDAIMEAKVKEEKDREAVQHAMDALLEKGISMSQIKEMLG